MANIRSIAGMPSAATPSSTFGDRTASTQDECSFFAYEDGGRAYIPRVRSDADRRDVLTDGVWIEKRRMITELYGFSSNSWEARTSPPEEGFWCFDSAQAAVKRAAPCEQPA